MIITPRSRSFFNGTRRLSTQAAGWVLISLFCLLILSACKEKKEDAPAKQDDTQVEFTQKSFNFGDITEGETVSHTFFFKNTGKHNLIIRKIETGCGCTTVNYKNEPVKAGKEGKIEIAFNSSGRYGKQYKEISIFANVPQKEIKLKFTANIK